MLLVLALLMLLGLILSADGPPPAHHHGPAAASLAGRNTPAPPQPGRPARDRLRAHVEPRDDDLSRSRPGAAHEPAPAPLTVHCLGSASPCAADPSSQPLFRTFCALLC
jgi:hypothetical protein